MKDKFKSRGATARIDRADLVVNYTETSDTTRVAHFVIFCYGTLGTKLHLRFDGQMGLLSSEEDVPLAPLSCAPDGQNPRSGRAGVKTRQGFVSGMNGDSEHKVDRALRTRVKLGRLASWRRASMRWSASTERGRPWQFSSTAPEPQPSTPYSTPMDSSKSRALLAKARVATHSQSSGLLLGLPVLTPTMSHPPMLPMSMSCLLCLRRHRI